MDEDECVRALLEDLESWGAADPDQLQGDDHEVVVPGVLCAVVVDIGCLHCGEATTVRGVIPSPHSWHSTFLDECRRLEIPPSDIRTEVVEFTEFLQAGGSAAVAAAPYRRDRDGEKVTRLLVLIVSRIV